MAYIALYRKWRPQDFDHLVGQDPIRNTLTNAIAVGKVSHAYIFAGPRGTGKTSTAKILAKALNCEQGPTGTPCNQCENCRQITDGTSMDVFEIDAASNRGIDEIRDLRETVKYAPVSGRYKVYIIDEVHMLTSEAFNALLKTLEEPPRHVVFVLATTEPHKIPATIHSRCQRYDFRRISDSEIAKHLQNVAAEGNLSIQDEAIRIIARQAEGGMRDALSILDQCTTIKDGMVTAEDVRDLLGLIGHDWIHKIVQAISEQDAKLLIDTLDGFYNLGKDMRQLLIELGLYFRALMLYKAAPGLDNLGVYSDDRHFIDEYSAGFSHDNITYILELLNKAANDVKWAQDPRVAVEMALLHICYCRGEDPVIQLTKRVSKLEAQLKNKPLMEEKPAATKLPDVHKPYKEAVKTVENVSETIDEQGQLKPIWDNVLQELLTEGKRSVHACVSQGKLFSLKDGQATVQFTANFPKERTEKEDYRAIVENVLTSVVGKPTTLLCLAVTPVRNTSAAATLSKTVKYPEAVEKAKQLFGGKVIVNHKEE